MGKRLNKALSLLLALSLAADPCLAAVSGAISSPAASSQSTLFVQRYQQEALALEPLAHRFFFRPFTNFWGRLKNSPYETTATAALALPVLGLVLKHGISLHELFLSGGLIIATILQNGGSNSDDSSKRPDAAQAAWAIYQKHETPLNHEDFEFSKELVSLYERFSHIVGVQTNPDVRDAAWLFKTPDKELHEYLKHQKTGERKQFIAQVNRLEQAFQTPYSPPQNVFKIERRVVTNQMGVIGKEVDSLDELLAVMAGKLLVLQNTHTAPEVRQALYREMTEVLAPFADRLGLGEGFFGERLRDEAFRTVYPERYGEIRDRIQATLGMNRGQAIQYQNDLKEDIRKDLPDSVKDTIFGEPKSIYSVHTKLEDPSNEYANVEDMEDLIRMGIVATSPEQVGEIMTIISRHLTGGTTQRGIPERKTRENTFEKKRVTGYNAWHITFRHQVGDKELPHEFIIFESPEEYQRYYYGWPNAHWAYASKHLTGQLPDFEPSEVNMSDPAGNFDRFKAAIAPWTYFFTSTIEGARLALTPRRIANEHGKRGNIADVAALIKLLNRKTSAFVYRLTFDPSRKDPDKQWVQSPLRNVDLHTRIHDGEVVRMMESTRSIKQFTHIIDALKQTASSFLTLIQIDKLSGLSGPKMVEKGEEVLVTRFREELPAAKYTRSISGLPDSYREAVLTPIAQHRDLENANTLIAAFGSTIMAPYFSSTRKEIWEEIRAATLTYGAKVLKEAGLPTEQNPEIILAAGLGWLPVESYKTAVKLKPPTFPSPGTAAAPTLPPAPLQPPETLPPAPPHTLPGPSNDVPNGTLPSGPYISITPTIKLSRNATIVDITLSPDQPAVMADLVNVISKHGNLLGGSRSVPTESGAFDHFVIENDPEFNPQGLQDDLAELQIEVRPIGLKPMVRITASIVLTHSKGQLNKFLQRLRDSPEMVGTNITWFAIDQDSNKGTGWLNITLAIPRESDVNILKPADRLKVFLNRLQTADRDPVKHFEMFPAKTNKATRHALLDRLKKEEASGVRVTGFVDRAIKRLWRQAPPSDDLVAETVHLIADEDEDTEAPDPVILEAYDNAIGLMKKYHSNSKPGVRRDPERRKSGDDYIVHPVRVTIRGIQHGEEDPVLHIARLLHDILENGAENMFRWNHPGEKVPKDPNHSELVKYRTLIEEDLRATFPDFEHRLIYTLQKFTNYRKDYSVYGRSFVDDVGTHIQGGKLDDGSDNLTTIFNVKDRKWSQDQIAKRIRFMLPIVATEAMYKDRHYKNTRITFLKTLAEQSNKLTLDEFLKPYYDEEESDENKKKQVHAEIVATIDAYLKWTSENADWFPAVLKNSEFRSFTSRLSLLRTRLDTPSHGAALNGHAQLPLGWQHRAGNWLLAAKEARHVRMARLLNLPILYQSIDFEKGSGVVQVETRSRWRSILFLMADPIPELLISAALWLSPWVTLHYVHTPVHAAIVIVAALILSPPALIFAALGTIASKDDWVTAARMIRARSQPKTLSGHATAKRPNALPDALEDHYSRKDFLKAVYTSARRNGMAVVFGAYANGKSTLFNGNAKHQLYPEEAGKYVWIYAFEGSSRSKIVKDLPGIVLNRMGKTRISADKPATWEDVKAVLGDRVILFAETLGFLSMPYEKVILKQLEKAKIPFVILNPVTSTLEDEVSIYRDTADPYFNIFFMKPLNETDTKDALESLARNDPSLQSLVIDPQGAHAVYALTGGLLSYLPDVMFLIKETMLQTRLTLLSDIMSMPAMNNPNFYYRDAESDTSERISGPLTGLTATELTVFNRFTTPIPMTAIESWSERDKYVVYFLARYGHLERSGGNIQIRGSVHRAKMITTFSQVSGHADISVIYKWLIRVFGRVKAQSNNYSLLFLRSA